MLVRLLDIDFKYLGIYGINLARINAKLNNYDLIKINLVNGLEVYKLGDYKKYRYSLNKKEPSKYKKIKSFTVKINSDWSDILIKLNKINKLLLNNYIIKLFIIKKCRYIPTLNHITIVYNNIINYLDKLKTITKTIKLTTDGYLINIKSINVQNNKNK